MPLGSQVRMQAQRTFSQIDRDKSDNDDNIDHDSCLCCAPILSMNRTDAGKETARDKKPVHFYQNVFDAFVCITKEEGFVGLYTGVVPTMMRAGVSS
jgi:hypothetical protein